MPVTLTIKQVPERLAERLRARATSNRRSMQGELLVILEEAMAEPPTLREPQPSPYDAKRERSSKKVPTHGRRLTLRELWARSRRLGGKSESESAEIIRKLRDGRYRR
jgi:hypothetical protein